MHRRMPFSAFAVVFAESQWALLAFSWRLRHLFSPDRTSMVSFKRALSWKIHGYFSAFQGITGANSAKVEKNWHFYELTNAG